MKQSLKVVKTPSEALALTNCAVLNPRDAKSGSLIRINKSYYLALKADGSIPVGGIGLSSCQRSWIEVSLGETIEGEFVSEEAFQELSSLLIEVKFLRKSTQVDTPFPTEHMATVFKEVFNGQPFIQGQSLIMDVTGHNLSLLIKSIEPSVGVLSPSTSVKFFAAPDSSVKLVGSTKTQANPNAHLIESFRFKDMGIGGLGREFADLFRRVFSSRLMQPQMKNEFGLMHVKGVLLFGPPGTGKTLIARQIGHVLRAREPKIVNGPEILNKFVGESEKNIRALFEDAEQEFKAKGDASQLHIIIFDELDAICRQRGAVRGDTGVGDSIVNQLLAKMDGVDQLDNIVIIGMTNRLELIDEALLRPGRFEVHIPIGLPDEEGRLEILRIHTLAMQKSNRLDASVDLAEIAALSRNFTGAELCGLIRSATSFALARSVQVGEEGSTRIDDSAIEVLKLTRQDFLQAFTEVKAANGISESEFAHCAPFGYIPFSPLTDDILSEAAMAVRQVQSGKASLYSLLLYGKKCYAMYVCVGPPGTGKTALAARIASESGFQYAKMINSYALLGMSEQARVAHIHKV